MPHALLRGPQEDIDAILAASSEVNKTPITKVNLIGHSMGGLDARVLISPNTAGSTSSADPRDQIFGMDYGDKIATLTTVATPHWGSPLADIALGIVPGPALDVLGFLIDLAGSAYNSTEPTENEIIEFCRSNTAHFKAPKTVIFEALPKTSTGKIQKFALRARARALT